MDRYEDSLKVYRDLNNVIDTAFGDGVIEGEIKRTREIAKALKAGGAALEYRLIYLAWPRAGDRLEIRSGAGGGDARFRKLVHWIVNPATGEPWGVAENISVSFDLETRKLITLGDEALALANASAIEGLTL